MSVYIFQDDSGDIKIGKAMHPRIRIQQHKVYINIVKVLAVIEGYTEKEDELHLRFKRHKIDGMNDWFRPHPELLEFISTLATPEETEAELLKTDILKIPLTHEEFDTLFEIARFCECYQINSGKRPWPSLSALNRALANIPEERWPELKQLLDTVTSSDIMSESLDS